MTAFREMAEDPRRSWQGRRSPEEIFHSKLELEATSRHSDDEKTDQQARDFFFQLGTAWDALAYERYEPGSRTEEIAAHNLSSSASDRDGTGPIIKLNPVQVHIIDALAEVAHIPRQRGQAEVEIPEKLRSYKWHMSAEYKNRLKDVAAKARGETPEAPREERPTPRQTGNEPAGAATETEPVRALAEQDAFYPAFWKRVIEQSSVAPQGQDPAYWPSRVLFEFDALASGDRAYIKDKAKYELAGKLAPIKDSIKKVRTAYQIVAYPACTSENMREAIEGELQMDKEIHERDQVELGSGEAEILRQLCEAPRYALYNDQKVLQPKIPFNPEQRVFKYADVFHPSPNIPKALNGAEWIKWMGEQARASKIVSPE